MLKRILAVIMVSCLFPVLAYAATWTLYTAAKTAGGALQVNGNTPQNSSNGIKVTYFQTGVPATVTVTPNAGYAITQVDYNGVITANPTETTYTVSGPNVQNVFAWFAVKRFSITSSVAGGVGGTVSPASFTNLVPGSTFTSARTVIFTPESVAYKVSGITGIPTGAAMSPADPVEGQSVAVTFPPGFVISSNIVLVGTFTAQNPIANAGATQSAIIGTNITLNGTGSISGSAGIYSYSWAQLSGPAVTLLNADTALPGFTPTTAGTYRFSLTLMPGGSTASTTVNISDSLATLARTLCYNCHYNALVGVASNVFGNWSSSGHKAKGVLCTGCHINADTSHSGQIKKGSVNKTTFDYTSAEFGSGSFCVTCHNPAIVTDFAASRHSLRAGSASCGFCHVKGVHNPVATCTDCHKTDNSYGLEWPPAAFTFHSSFTGSTNVCKVCHTTHNPKVLSIKTSCP
ncbi:MAG: PKD domain-containing protein [Desulfuromonadaceae bacterium]